MSVLHVLGSGAAYSDGSRTTTMLALEGPSGVVVVDCGGDVVQRLLAHGLDPLRVTALIVTHEHADHVGGLPLMLERLWLAGRRMPLPVIGIAAAVAQAVRLHDAFDTSGWPAYAGIAPRVVDQAQGSLVLDDADWRLTGAPGVHAVPVIGLRIEPKDGGIIAAYSCDTAYEPAIVELARGVDLLLHEAAGGPSPIHASAGEAARVAVEAEAGRLVLVHLPPGFDDASDEVACARRIFPALEVGYDGARYPLTATGSSTSARAAAVGAAAVPSHRSA